MATLTVSSLYRRGVHGSIIRLCFISYASLVSNSGLQQTISIVRPASTAVTPFEKAQEEVLISQLSDPKFASLQTFFIPANMDMTAGGDQTRFLGPAPKDKNHVSLLIFLEHLLVVGQFMLLPLTPRSHLLLIQDVSIMPLTQISSLLV
jgi:hypothetical protein